MKVTQTGLETTVLGHVKDVRENWVSPNDLKLVEEKLSSRIESLHDDTRLQTQIDDLWEAIVSDLNSLKTL